MFKHPFQYTRSTSEQWTLILFWWNCTPDKVFFLSLQALIELMWRIHMVTFKCGQSHLQTSQPAMSYIHTQSIGKCGVYWTEQERIFTLAEDSDGNFVNQLRKLALYWWRLQWDWKKRERERERERGRASDPQCKRCTARHWVSFKRHAELPLLAINKTILSCSPFPPLLPTRSSPIVDGFVCVTAAPSLLWLCCIKRG